VRASSLADTLHTPKNQPLIGIFPATAVLGTDSILWHQTEEKTHIYPDVESKDKKAGLDHNHSHFILVEDDAGTDFGAETALRQEFEGAFRQRRVVEHTSVAAGWSSLQSGIQQAPSTSQGETPEDLKEELRQVPVVSICGTETCT
jgi:hypothetical protein